MYRQRYIKKEPHPPWRPLKSKFCLKTLGTRLFLYAELDVTISFPSEISLAHDSSFKKDQDILVLPLDLQKFDTHEKLAQDVLKHFGKVKRNKYIGLNSTVVGLSGQCQSSCGYITVITDKHHDLVN